MHPNQSSNAPRIWRDTALIVLFAGAVILMFLGSRPFSTRGEPREALVAQAMLESDNWLLGSGYGGVVPSKPPFMHWFVSTFSLVTGDVDEWSARLPSALAAIGFMVLWFRFLYPRIGRSGAFLAVALLCTSVEWYRAATTTRVDMTLAALIGCAFIGLYSWWERRLTGFPILTVLALCGATLTKGPVALVLPGAVFGIFLLIRGEPLFRILTRCLMVFVPALLGAALWYVAAYVERGPEFFHKVYYENFARLTSTQEDSPHKNSALYLLGTMPLGLLPWTLICVPLLGGVLAFLRRGPAEWLRRLRSAAPLTQFAWIASLVFIVFFSIPEGKRSVYLLPIYPFLALGLAVLLLSSGYENWRATRWVVRSFSGVMLLVGVMLATAPLWLSQVMAIESIRSSRGLFQNLEILQGMIAAAGLAELSILVIFIGVAIAAVLLGHRFYARYLGVPVIFGALLICVQGAVLTPAARQLSGESFVPEILEKVPASAALYSVWNEFYGLSFYLHREIKPLSSEPREGDFILLYERNLSRLPERLATGTIPQQLAISPNAIDKPGQKVVLVRIEKAG